MRKELTVVLEIEDDEDDAKRQLDFAVNRVEDTLIQRVQEDVAPVTLTVAVIPGERTLPL